MSETLTGIQQAMIAHFEAAQGGYPKLIEPYGGQLLRPGELTALPALYVDAPANFTIDSDDARFELLNFDAPPELVLFAHNEAGSRANQSAMTELTDWCVDALQGAVLTVNGVPLSVQRIRGRIITDYPKSKVAVGVLTVEFTSFQN